MSVQATDKYQKYTDRDGNQLNNGYIYIGTSGLNPETNPIATYYDSALTIPAPQPLRTIGGYVVYGGSPANIYVAGDYSITVRDNDLTIIYSSLSDNIEPAQTLAVTAAANAATALAAAVSAQADVDAIAVQLPTIAPGDAGKILEVNVLEDGYDLVSISTKAVDITTAQTVAGIKTFSSFPITPSSAPTTDYQVANKKYVDDGLNVDKIRAWVNFNGSGTVAIRASSNVTSITDLGVGNYQVNFNVPISDANYSFSINASSTGTNNKIMTSIGQTPTITTSALSVYTTTDDAATVDPSYVSVVIVR